VDLSIDRPYLIIGAIAGYWPASRLLARQHGSEKPEFRFHFAGIAHSIRDFLSKEFAMTRTARPAYGRPLAFVATSLLE
jgi:hypothetical protein